MGLPQLQPREVVTNDGLRTPYGIVLPPGANVAAYVRSTGVQSTDSAFVATNLVSTLAQGLARARTGLGDFVICLPGHVETVVDGTTFSGALLAGTKILGVGRGSNTPTFNFTLPGSNWAVTKADVSISGVRIAQSAASAQNTTSGITVTGADFGFFSNELVPGSGSSSFTSSAIDLQAGADRADISGNIMRAPNGGTNTIIVSGAISDARIADNEILVPNSTTLGNIQVTAAAVRLKILRNVLANSTAVSVASINLANVAISGQCSYNTIGVLNTGAVTSGTTGITIGAAVTMGFFQNFVVNDVLKSGLLLPTADT